MLADFKCSTCHDPAAPAKPTAFDTLGQTLGVTVEGSLAYVADVQAGLQIVDLSNPSTPRVVGGFETARPARDVAVAGSLVLVVVGGVTTGAMISIKGQTG